MARTLDPVRITITDGDQLIHEFHAHRMKVDVDGDSVTIQITKLAPPKPTNVERDGFGHEWY